jgi:hypothetical protein
LGVFRLYVGTVFTRCVASDVYDVGPGGVEHKRALIIARLRSELMRWYKDQRRLNPNVPMYEIGDLTPNMVSDHDISTKAAETGSLVPFALSLSQRFQHSLEGGQALVAFGEALVGYLRVTRGSARRLTAKQQQDLCMTAIGCSNKQKKRKKKWNKSDGGGYITKSGVLGPSIATKHRKH